MNSIQAYHLFKQLENQINIDKPIKPQLQKLLIPTFWNGQLVLRNSLRGRVASFLELPSEFISNKKKIIQVFSKAIQTLLDSNNFEKINLDLGVKLMEELYDDQSATLQELDPELTSSPEINALKNQKDSKSIAYWDKIRGLSLLHNVPDRIDNPIDISTLQSLFHSNASFHPIKALDYLEAFLNKNPTQYGVKNWKDKLERLRKSFEMDQKITSLFQSDGKPLTPEEKTNLSGERAQLLSKLSDEMNLSVHAMDSSINEKKLIQFSYGPRYLSVTAFFELIKVLPESALKPVPEQYRNLLLANDMQSMEAIAEKLVHTFFEKVKSAELIRQSPITDALRVNPDRRLPDFVSSALPKLFQIWLENILKKGVIGNVANFIPENNTAKALEWISENSDAIFLNDPKKLKELEAQCIDFLKNHFKSTHENWGQSLLSAFKGSQTILSPQMMELLGIDHVMVSGPLWLEFEKNHNNTFNVTVYTLGNALNYHPIDPATGKQYAVMRLTDIKADKLNKEFFYSLLKRHVDPIDNPQACSKAYDIYSGPLQSLEWSIDQKNYPDDPQDLHDKPPTNWQLSLSLLLKKYTQEENPTLELRLQALLNLCLPLMKDDRLVIPDIETCRILETTLNQIDKHLHETTLHPKAAEIKATCTEIRQAIFNTYEILKKRPINAKVATIPVDKDMLAAFREFIAKTKFTQKQLQEYRGTISWMLGEEVGELIDHILEHSEHLLPEDNQPASGSQQNGFLQQFNTSIYAEIAYNVSQIAALGAGFAYGGFWYLLDIFVLNRVLSYFLPPTALEWYNRVKAAVYRKIPELIMIATLRIPRVGDKLKTYAADYRQSIKKTTSILKGEKNVTYMLASPTPLKNKDSSTTTQPKLVDVPTAEFENSLRGFRRFCPVSEIKCKALEGQDHLSKIAFSPKLSFNIKQNPQNGNLEAISDIFPDYHLAEDQSSAALNGIPSYLILENQAGKKKVLIPKNQWLQTIVGRTTSISGPFSELWISTIASSIRSNPDDYFCVDIESCAYTKEKVILRSSDPEASIYLLCLYYFLDNKKALNQAYQHFDWICNIKPISDEIWTQLIPLALVPIDIAGIKNFRRRLFSAITQNRLRFKDEANELSSQQPKPAASNLAKGYSIGSDLLLGFVTLLDLNDYLENKNPREHLSIEQEYHLYKFAFEKLSNVLKVLPQKLGQKHKEIFENGGIESLLEFSGLSDNLNKRYLEIKHSLGIHENFLLSSLVGIIKTPSTVPEYVIPDNGPAVPQYNKQEQFGIYASRIFSYCRSIKLTHLQTLKLDFKTMNPDIQSIPTLKADEMTSEIIKMHFPAYYSLARNDKLVKTDTSKESPREQLKHVLKLIKGMEDKQSQILMQYLEAVLLQPDKFPPTVDLLKCLNHEQNLHSFFENLNDLTFDQLVEKDVVDPFFRSIIKNYGSYVTADTLSWILNSYMQLPSGLTQEGVDITTKAMKYLIAEKLVDLSQPLFKHLPSPVKPFMENSENSTYKKAAIAGARLLAPLGLIWAFNYALSYAAMPTVASGQRNPEDEQNQSMLNYVTYQALTMVGAAFLRIVLANGMNSNLKLRSILPGTVHSLIKTVNKTYNYVKPSVSNLLKTFEPYLGEPYEENDELIKLDYSDIEAADKSVNAFLNTQLNRFFDIEKNPENSQKTHFKIKDDNGLLPLYASLKQFRYTLAKHIKDEKGLVLNLFNMPFKFGPQVPLSLSLRDIHKLIDKEDLSKIGKQAGLSKQDLPSVNLAIARVDHKKFRLKQVDKIISLMVDLSKESVDKSSNAYIEKLQQLGMELESSSAPILQNAPTNLLRKFLQHQASSKTALISMQSFADQPIAKAFSVYPNEHPDSVMKQLHEQRWNIFGTRSHLIHINSKREKPITMKKLQTLLVLIKGAVSEKEHLHISPEDIQVLQSLFIDRMHRYRYPPGWNREEDQGVNSLLIDHRYRYRPHPGWNSQEDKEYLILLKQILHLIKLYGAEIPRKTLETNNAQQLIYPIGNLKTIKANYFRITEACMKYITRDPILKDFIKRNDLPSMDITLYHNTIKPRLAEKMSRYGRFNIHGKAERKEFIDFVCDNAQEIPSWITSDSKLYREISLVKGHLNHLLPMNFSKKLPVALKKSMNIPYETLFNEALTLASTGINQTQSLLLADKLMEMALNQTQKSNIDYHQTYFYKKFGHIFTREKFEQAIAKVRIDPADIEKLSEHPDASMLYMRYFLREQIRYWEYNIKNTPEDLASLFNHPSFGSKQTAYDKISEIPDENFNSWMSVYDEFEDDFISKTEDDPAYLFGFTKYEASKEGFINPLADLGIEQKIELTKVEEIELEKVQRDEFAKLMKEDVKNNDVQEEQFEQKFFQEWDWPAISDPAAIDWLKFSSPSEHPHKSDSFFSMRKIEGFCPIYQVQDLLLEAGNPALLKAAFKFDSRLWMTNNYVKRLKIDPREHPQEIGSKQQAYLDKVLIHVEEIDGKLKIKHMGALSDKDAEIWKVRLSYKKHWENEKTKAILWNTLSNQYEAGYPVGQTEFEKNVDLKTLINQLKILNGDIKYPYSKKEMETWVENNDPKTLQKAFDTIYQQRQKENKAGNDIDHIFVNALGLHYEDLM